MFNGKKITFIGSGAMGEAMISGVIRNQLADPSALMATDPRAERLAELRNRYKIQTFTDNIQAACQADVMVLSIKPQALNKVMAEIENCIDRQNE